MALTRLTICDGTSDLWGVLSPMLSMLVLMNAFVVSTTICLAMVFLRKTTFQPSLLTTIEKNTNNVWLGKMKGFAMQGSLCRKFTTRKDGLNFCICGIPSIILDFHPLALQ